MKLRKSPEAPQPQAGPKQEKLNHGESRRLEKPVADAETVKKQLGFEGFELLGVANIPVGKSEKVGHDGRPHTTETSKDFFIFRATEKVVPALINNLPNYPSSWATRLARQNEITVIDGDSLSTLVDIAKSDLREEQFGAALHGTNLRTESVRPGDSLTIGRHAAFGEMLDADRAFASREHLRIDVSAEGAVQVMDMSSNGTELTSM